MKVTRKDLTEGLTLLNQSNKIENMLASPGGIIEDEAEEPQTLNALVWEHE